MDELKYLLRVIEGELESLKNKLVHGLYRSQDAYFEVLGEAKSLIKISNEAKALLAKRNEDDDESSDGI